MPAKIKELYDAMMDDQPSAREALIEYCVPFCRIEAEKVAAAMRSLVDDLFGEACVSLVRIVDRLRKREQMDKPKQYILWSIAHEIRRKVPKYRSGWVPGTYDGSRPTIRSLTESDCVTSSDIDNDIEELEACCTDSVDLTIVQLLAQNFKRSEVACVAGISPPNVNYRLKRIERVYLRRNPTHNRKSKK